MQASQTKDLYDGKRRLAIGFMVCLSTTPHIRMHYVCGMPVQRAGRPRETKIEKKVKKKKNLAEIGGKRMRGVRLIYMMVLNATK